MARLEQERLEAQAREQALAASVASKKKQLLTDLVSINRFLLLDGKRFIHVQELSCQNN